MKASKWRLIVGMLLTLSLLAAACGDGDDDAADETEAPTTTAAAQSGGDETTTTGEATTTTAAEALPTGQTLSWWGFGATGLEPRIAEWEEATGNTVEIKNAGFDEHHEALLTALASGSVPDVAIVEVGYSSLFKASPQVFTNLGAEYDAGALESNFLDWRWIHGVAADGTIIGIPTDVGGMAIAYRWDLFEQAGLPTDRDEVCALWENDWNAFLDAGDTFVAGTGKPFIDSGGTLYQAILNQGSVKYYADETTLVYETNEQNKKAWDLAVDAINRDLSAALGNFSPEWNAGMANGDYALLMAPSWMMGYIQGQGPDTAGLWDITCMPEGGGNWGGSQLTIPAGAPNADLAWDLINYVLSPDSQFKVFVENGNFPSIPSLYDNEEVQSFTNEFFNNAPVGKIYSESAISLVPIYEGENERSILREFGNGLSRIEQGMEDGETAWQTSLDAIALVVG